MFATISNGLTLTIALIGLVVGLVGRTFLGNALSKLFRGQTVHDTVESAADYMASVESAYNILAQEKRALEERVTRQDQVIEGLRRQVDDLRKLVTAKDAIDALAKKMDRDHTEVMAVLRGIGHVG